MKNNHEAIVSQELWDKVLCRVHEDVCINLLETYQHEQTALKAEVEEITKRDETEKQDKRDVDEFIRRLKKYAGMSVLTREMALELIEYVTVDDNPRSTKIPREIYIYYSPCSLPSRMICCMSA